MKRIAIILGLTTAAFAQQPAKLFIKSERPAPKTTAALLNRCPKAVTVTNSPEGAKYVLEVAVTQAKPPEIKGVFHKRVILSVTYSGILYENGASVAAFKDLAESEQLAEQTCKYIEGKGESKQ
jgi:hypothetical protein